jgi:hypothetical protein
MFGSHKHLENKLRSHGESAPAEITAIQQTHTEVSHGGSIEVVVKLTLLVRPSGSAAFEHQTTTRQDVFSAYNVGDEVTVLYDPNNHDSLVVDRETTDANRGAASAAADLRSAQADQRLNQAFGYNAPPGGVNLEPGASGGPGMGGSGFVVGPNVRVVGGADAAALLNAILGAQGAEAIASLRAQRRGGPPAADPSTPLATLKSLHDQGLLADDEYETQRQRIIDEV